MALTLTTVTGTIDLPSGDTPVAARLIFELTGWASHGPNIFVKGPQEFPVGSSGDFAISLQTTVDLGVSYNVSVGYRVPALGRDFIQRLGVALVPSSGPVDLTSIMSDVVPPPAFPDWLSQVLSARDETISAAELRVRDPDDFLGRPTVYAGGSRVHADTGEVWDIVGAGTGDFNHPISGVGVRVVQGLEVQSAFAGGVPDYRPRRYLDALPLSPWDFVSVIDFKPDSDDPRTWDWGPAIQAALDRAPNVNLPMGYYPLFSPVEIGTDHEGGSLTSVTGREGCTLESFISDDTFALTLEGTAANRLGGFSTGGFRLTGGDRNQNLLDMSFLEMCEFDQLDIRSTYGRALRSKGNWDCKFFRTALRGCGDFDNQIPVIDLITYETDGNNAIKFIDGHLESNRYIYALARNPTGSARTNGLIWFLGTKFHGRHVTTADIHPFIDVDGHINVQGCYFYLAGDHFIKLRSSIGSVIMGNWFAVGQNVASSVWMADGSLANMIGPNQYSGVAGPIQENPGQLNYILEPHAAAMRMRDGMAMFDDGGRLAMAKNLIRAGATYYKPVGATAGHAWRVTNSDTDGVQMMRADAGGADGDPTTPYQQWGYSMSGGMKLRVPTAFDAGRPTRTVMSPDGAPYIPAYFGSVIGGISSVLNTTGKYDGKAVRDASNNKRLVIADGPAAGDVWRFADGTVAYTPA